MGKSKLLALVMCIAILMPVFTSCSAKSGGHKVVKADDPWFDSLRFKLEQDFTENDEELAPYYAGDRSLDDAIKYVNDRTAKYVREM